MNMLSLLWGEEGTVARGIRGRGMQGGGKSGKGINQKDRNTENNRDTRHLYGVPSSNVYFSYRILFNPHGAPGGGWFNGQGP